MAAAEEDTDGDRFIEVVSVGALYRGEEWERKYWSCSRGKDRYPYPVGYHTVRHFFGISYTMEIQEGPRGPVFLVTSTEGDSAAGPTPDIAWKNFQKKSGAKVRNWQRRRSFPQKIDGAELFGFKNASVQRMLRELIVYATGAAVRKLPSPVTADAASPSNKVTTNVCDVEGMPVCLDKTSRTGKRIMKPSQMESPAKRVHYQDTYPSVTSSSESARGNANEGNVSDSRCDRVPDYLKRTSVDDSLGEPSQSSSQQVDLSSGSYLGSENSDLESAEKEAARFMLSFFLPQAIPFLKKSKKKKKKKSKQKNNKIVTGSLGTAPAQKPSDDCCKGATFPATVGTGININGSETYLHGRSLCDMVKDGSANEDCTKDDSAVKLDVMNDVVEDSFEEDIPIWVYNKSKYRGIHHHVSDDACSRELNEHSKDHFEVKLDETRDVVEDSFEENGHISGDSTFKSSAVHYHMSDDACSGQPNEHSNDESAAKLDEMVDVVEDSFEEDAHVWGDHTFKSNAVRHHMADDAYSGQPNEHSKDESAVKLDEMENVVEDSFEEDAHILGDNISKSRGIQHHVSDDACSRQPNEHSKDESVVKLDEMKDVEDSFEEDAHILGDNTSKSRDCHHHVSDFACSREPNEHSKDESLVKLDEMKDVEDRFEEDIHILGDNTSKSRGVHHHVPDDACSTEPNENSKVLDGTIKGQIESFDRQVAVHDSTQTPDMVYDHEKGKYILSDSFLAFLEEEFGGDECPYPENYNQCNNMSEQIQIEQQFKDPTDGMKDGLVSLDVSCHKNIDNGLVDVCAQAQCRYGNENTMMSIRRESNLCEQISPKVEHNLSHHQHHAFSSGSGHRLEFVGCYLHPMPVLSIMLITKNHINLYICVLCGFMKSFQRFLYIYTINRQDQQDTQPRFVGYTPLVLPSLEQSSTGNVTFGRSGLQITSDGQFVVLMSSIGIPFCSTRDIDCLCCVCKSHRCDDNSLKIVSVNFGYASLITKLMPYGTVSCILICEPNCIVAAENSNNLHIWKMIAGWSRTSEDYVIPSLGHAGSSILELRRMSRNSSLIIGHDGAGGFCLWDISRRTLLATFAAPGNIIFQILPVSFGSLQEHMIHAPIDAIEKRLQEVTVSDMSTKVDRESFLLAQREDIAVWVLVSSASVAEYQHDLRAKKHNARWRLALLAKKKICMGNILDSRATAVDTFGNYGLAGTYGGLLYMWELSSGRKLSGTQCINGGRVSCIAVDAESGAVAVADDRCRLLLYTQKVLSDAWAR